LIEVSIPLKASDGRIKLVKSCILCCGQKNCRSACFSWHHQWPCWDL